MWASPFSFRLVAELTPDQDGGTLLRGSLGVARTKMIVVGLFLLVLVVFGHGLTLGVATLVSAVVVEVLYGAAFVLVSRRGRPSTFAYVDKTSTRTRRRVRPVPGIRDPAPRTGLSAPPRCGPSPAVLQRSAGTDPPSDEARPSGRTRGTPMRSLTLRLLSTAAVAATATLATGVLPASPAGAATPAPRATCKTLVGLAASPTATLGECTLATTGGAGRSPG